MKDVVNGLKRTCLKYKIRSIKYVLQKKKKKISTNLVDIKKSHT
jgi:hypothetical protein